MRSALCYAELGVSAVFARRLSLLELAEARILPSPAGPEHYPWDHTHGYQSVLGVMMVSGLTLASFGGGSAAAGSCLGGTYALANHVFAPDASHPHFLRNINLQSTSSQGLFLMTDTDPEWMNESDCGMAEVARSDGSILKLNCAGG